MANTVKASTFSQTDRRRQGRAVNAVAELLRTKLSVPNIYLEPPSKLITADVLAVDRAGAGDLHAVEIKISHEIPLSRQFSLEAQRRVIAKPLEQAIQQIMKLPAHYRYLGLREDVIPVVESIDLFSPDGIGRIGIIAIIERDNQPPVAELKITPERFRVAGEKLQGLESKLLEKVRPDIEVRI
jgi:hypothetical protein